MRLTLITSSLRAGGAERVLALMASYWARGGAKVSLLTLSDPGETPFYPLHPAVHYRPLGIAGVSGDPVRALANNVGRLRILRDAVRESIPDVVISFLDRVNVLTLLATAGLALPVVVSERIDPRHRMLGRSWKLLRLLSYPLAARVVVQTEAALSYFPAPIRRRGLVIPNPVQLPNGASMTLQELDGGFDDGRRTTDDHRSVRIRSSVVRRQSSRAHEGLPKSGAGIPTSSSTGGLVLAMGRLEAQKGFDMLLQAFARVVPTSPGWDLEIWGEGPLRAELEARRDALGLAGRVQLPGLTREPGARMAQADLFVLSSRYEGFPNVLCEAMACGLPVVSFDCPSGPREIIRDGVDGVLVPPNDVATLAAAIGELINKPTVREGLAARSPEVLSRFGVEKVMGIWEALLQELSASASSSSSARSTTVEPNAS